MESGEPIAFDSRSGDSFWAQVSWASYGVFFGVRGSSSGGIQISVGISHSHGI